MRSAAVHRRRDKYLLNPYSRTTAGLWIVAPPFSALDGSSDEDQVGESVVRTMSHSQDNVPHPTDWSSLSRPLYELAGVKSWRKFLEGCELCDVEEDDGTIEVSGWRNTGKEFEPIEDMVVSFRWDGSARQVGKAILEMLRKIRVEA